MEEQKQDSGFAATSSSEKDEGNRRCKSDATQQESEEEYGHNNNREIKEQLEGAGRRVDKDSDGRTSQHLFQLSQADRIRRRRRSSIVQLNMEEESIRFKPDKEVDPDAVEEEWSFDHARLLYLVSKFAMCACDPNEKESWIRQLSLLVLMFEAITDGCIDFDYAPASTLVTHEGRSRRVWLNITQEGKAAIDDLREKRLLNGLKLSTEDFQPVTAYQVSAKGREFLSHIPRKIIEQMDDFVYAPQEYVTESGERKLLVVQFDGEAFHLTTRDESYSKESDVTETEDVSYVSSPFLPACIRNTKEGFAKPFTSNYHRRHESAAGGSNIQDELDEAIVLGEVHAYVGEWIPFGANQIVALNERLGALDRCQGGLFTAMVDKSPTDTQFKVPPGLTQVTILDYDFVRFINFEAEINYPEDEGIVQIENFGMHLNVDGTIIYGMKVEAIIDRTAEHISLDHLSRVLVDVHQDSSTIMNDLLSQYQRNLLEMLFMGDSEQRNKFNCIVAEHIEPKLPADGYMDKSDNENELKQILGDLRAAHDLGPDDVILIGREGVLLAGPSVSGDLELVVCYIGLLCREIFIRNFFVRTFILNDSLKQIRTLIMTYRKDPNNIGKIRTRLNGASRDIILLNEVLEYLKESLAEAKMPTLPKDAGESAHRLHRVLNCEGMKGDAFLRCEDLVKLIEGAKNQLRTLQQMTDVINTKQLEDVFKNVEANTKALVDASEANERSSASLELMQVILAGSFAFDIVDRLSGGSLNITVPKWVVDGIIDPIISKPGLWWVLNMCWLVLISVLLRTLMAYLGRQATGFLTLRVRINRKMDQRAIRRYLASKSVKVSEIATEAGSQIEKVAWEEPSQNAPEWGGSAPTIEITFDFVHGFLLTAFFQIDAKRTEVREEGLLQIFLTQLYGAGVIEQDQEAQKKRNMPSNGDRAGGAKVVGGEEGAEKEKEEERETGGTEKTEGNEGEEVGANVHGTV